MKIVDANVLLYAVNSASRQHVPAHRWLTGALSGSDTVGFPWVSVLAFLRISTNPRIFPNPLRTDEAFDIVAEWMAQPSALEIGPTSRHLLVLRGLAATAGTAANLVSDAHLAALAVEHGATVVTFDRDFARFDVPVHIPT